MGSIPWRYDFPYWPTTIERIGPGRRTDSKAQPERLQRWTAASQLPFGPPVDPLIDRVREVLADDLRTPSALDAVDSWVQTALTRGGQEPTSPGEMATLVDTLLGIRLT